MSCASHAIPRLSMRLGARFCAMFVLALAGAKAHAMVPPSERAVLDAIWYGTGGQLPGGSDSTWINRGGWGLPPFLGISECGSYGITCVVDQHGQEHVYEIALDYNGLTGELPSSLNDLPYLTRFSVSHNQIGGSVPTLSSLTNLQSFSVHGNQLTGPIPALNGLANLGNFDVAVNQLTGPLPALSGLTNLYYFNASNNGLSGSIPPLGGLTSLQVFEVDLNQLTGPIPSLTGLTNLTFFLASSNRLTGSIPPLSALTNLQALSARLNQLTGSIPELAGLTNLAAFYVDHNQLDGSVPELIGLTNLQTFWIDHNRLEGYLPYPPASLALASVCPNPLTFPSVVVGVDPQWDSHTGYTPWWAAPFASNACDDVFNNDFEALE